MTIQISEAQIQTMHHHVSRTYPQEGCGVLLGRLEQDSQPRKILEVRSVTNAWSDDVAKELVEAGITPPQEPDHLHSRRDRYWIDPRDLLGIQRYARSQQFDMIGIYHSHPDHPAVPSECDRLLAWSGYSYIIISVLQGQPQDPLCWRLDDHHRFQPEPLDIQF
jgi:proteasome lid subunit RPN8/RPN11